jgi:nucleotide-binding universal stress UspA family protein
VFRNRLEIGMYRRILIPTDGSRLSRKAIEEGVALAASLGATVVGFHARMPVMLPYAAPIALSRKTQARMEKPGITAAKRYLTAIEAAARKSGVAFKGIDIVGPYPADSIIRTARKEKCELIVMAAHGRRGVLGMLLGSETNHVLMHSHIPVLVVR